MTSHTFFTRLVTAVALALMISLGSACAATLEIPVKAHAVISDGMSEIRILLDFGDLSNLSGKKILYAKCYLNIDTDTCVNVLNELEVKPVTKAWSVGSVDWVSQWARPGGDANEELTRTVSLQRGRNGDTEILLTDIIQGWADGSLQNFGLIIDPRFDGCSYGLKAKQSYPSSGLGKLLVRFVRKIE